MNQPFSEFIGSSPAMQKVYDTVLKVANTDANVLILGENGTGKELVARSLHHNSARGREVFISVDMGAISESLFESELFGHVKGAFTDAVSDRAGRFEIASGGTLFLDEIANLSAADAGQDTQSHRNEADCEGGFEQGGPCGYQAHLRHQHECLRNGGRRRIPPGPSLPD